MNWAMPCARSPLRVRGPTTLGWKRLSCQITRAKNSSGRLCARAADSIIRHTDSRRSAPPTRAGGGGAADLRDRKSTRLNSSHVAISYAVFCLKKKKKKIKQHFVKQNRIHRRRQ